MSIRFLSLFLFAPALVMGCAAEETDENVTSDQAELVGGEFTYERPEFGKIVLSGGTFCSASLIGQHSVVTAAHCVDWGNVNTPGQALGRFYVERSATDSKSYRFDGYVSYGTKGKGGTDDVAILRLLDPVPATVATPVKISTYIPTDASNTPVTIYGYGCSRRADWLGNKSDAPDDHAFKKQKRSFEMGPIRWICPGDSGGPTAIGSSGPIFRVSSWAYYFELFGIGPQDAFGDLVKYKSKLEAQAAAWGN